jgi:hypothetical protein
VVVVAVERAPFPARSRSVHVIAYQVTHLIHQGRRVLPVRWPWATSARGEGGGPRPAPGASRCRSRASVLRCRGQQPPGSGSRPRGVGQDPPRMSLILEAQAPAISSGLCSRGLDCCLRRLGPRPLPIQRRSKPTPPSSLPVTRILVTFSPLVDRFCCGSEMTRQQRNRPLGRRRRVKSCKSLSS